MCILFDDRLKRRVLCISVFASGDVSNTFDQCYAINSSKPKFPLLSSSHTGHLCSWLDIVKPLPHCLQSRCHGLYVLHASIRASVHASVHPHVRDCMFPLYLQHLLMDFHRTFVFGAFWDKDELIRFWGQRSRSHYRSGGVQHSTLPSSSGL